MKVKGIRTWNHQPHVSINKSWTPKFSFILSLSSLHTSIMKETTILISVN